MQHNIVKLESLAFEPLVLVMLDANDRWYVAGKPTRDPLMLLAAIWGSLVTMRA